MNKSHECMDAPDTELTWPKVFGVHLYKNNAHALLWRILSLLNSDWLQ